MEYEGKYLLNGSDVELFVLKQLGVMLFCLRYSSNHKRFNFECHTEADVKKYSFEVQNELPWWWDENELMVAYDRADF